MTFSLTREIRDLCDSIETTSFFDSNLESECKSKSIDTTYTSALPCIQCKAAVVAEVTTKLYNLDQYEEHQKVDHRHPADPYTICDVLERIATEIRLLDKWDPNDYAYLWRIKRDK